MPSNHLILFCPLVLLPSICLSIRVFFNESALHIRWPKYWSFSFSISPSNEYSGLIYFRMDWFDLLAVQGTLKSLRQHHSSKAPVLQCSAFFMVQLSHLTCTFACMQVKNCCFLTCIQISQEAGKAIWSNSHMYIFQYMTTGKTIALTRQTFVGKMISLLFNMLL